MWVCVRARRTWEITFRCRVNDAEVSRATGADDDTDESVLVVIAITSVLQAEREDARLQCKGRGTSQHGSLQMDRSKVDRGEMGGSKVDLDPRGTDRGERIQKEQIRIGKI